MTSYKLSLCPRGLGCDNHFRTSIISQLLDKLQEQSVRISRYHPSFTRHRMEDDALSSALSSRRMAHGRGRNNARGSKNTGRAIFDPLRAFGVYEIKCGAVKSESGVSHLTIHGFTPGETGLFASLQLRDALVGVAVLAGSRKGVKEIVEDLEEEDEIEEEEGEEEDGGTGVKVDETENGLVDQDKEDEDEEDDAETSESEQIEPRSAMEEEDDRINRRAKAFEKNSFRNPKFWMCFNADVKVSKDIEAVHEQDMGYIVFSGNDCSAFDGTISSKELSWDNVKIKGHKVKSRVSDCSQKWTDFSFS